MSSALRHLTIVTGASRGMGLAMALQRLREGHRVLGISRAANPQLQKAGCEQWQRDLSVPEPVAAELERWLAEQVSSGLASVALINNAGVIARIAPLDAIPAGDLALALRVDLEAPMLLSAAFLRATDAWSIARKLLNISSGLGRSAMASQAAYCAAKAGMDHFTRCVALEQAARENGARVCSLAPGVIDTDMQAQLRGADAKAFPDRGMFVGLKDKQALTSPEAAAERVLAYLDRADFGQQAVADVRG